MRHHRPLDTAVPSPRPGLSAPSLAGAHGPWLDVCAAGVLLRVLLFVHGVLGLGLALVSPDLGHWLNDFSLVVAMALPATGLWLGLACGLQARLTRWSGPLSLLALPAAGAACALVGWAPLSWLAGALRPALGGWTIALLGAALAAAVQTWLIHRARLQLPAATTARLAELQSRIRPHFLFNTLNSAIALVALDPQRAEEVLEDLAELFRAALQEGGETVTLGQEVELAQRYLAIEQVRFGERLRVHWSVDPRACPAKVPALFLQPLVENAVLHGAEPAAGGADLWVKIALRGDQVDIRIRNPLPPVAAPKGQGMALHNVRERLMLLHDLGVRFRAGARQTPQGECFDVRITLPLASGGAPS
jgi:two-component system sensor histidine kinase AlgZ